MDSRTAPRPHLRILVALVAALLLGSEASPISPRLQGQGGSGSGLASIVLASHGQDGLAPFYSLAEVGPAERLATHVTAAQPSSLASGPPYWLPVTRMQLPCGACVATVGLDGRIYALGGGPDGSAVQAYTPATNRWSLVAPMLHYCAFCAAATGPDGHIYAFSGNGPVVVTSTEAYAPQQNRWLRLPDEPGDHFGGGAVRGPDGRLYVIGGTNGDNGEGEVDVYDTRAKRWTRVPDLPTPRAFLGVTLGLDERIYTVGGTPGTPDTLATVEAYNVSTRRWTHLTDIPTSREGLAAVAGADGRIYAVGGADASTPSSPSPSYAEVNAYDPGTGRWQTVAPLRTARQFLAAVRGVDGRIYAVGGATSTDRILTTVEAYGPLISVTPPSVPVAGSVALTGTNFATSATVTVTWGTAPGGGVLATGHTTRAGTLLHPLRVRVPAGVRPGRYTLTAMDDRSRYPVTTSLGVGVHASFGLAPTPPPLSQPTATPTTITSLQARYVAL